MAEASPPAPARPVRLRLEGLRLSAQGRTLLDGVDLELVGGRIDALVGASGCGKSLTARALLGLLPPGVRREAGRLALEVDGQHLQPFDDTGPEAFTALRGPVLGWLPQHARAALDPLRRVGDQVRDCLRLSGREPLPARWLERAGLGEAEHVAGLYPHELSGGMAQRVNIALALARGSRLLLADEPTTGLDPTVQEGVLGELVRLRNQGVGVLFITHDLRLVPRLADHLRVMHGGRVVEDLPTDQLHALQDPAAQALWDATARIAAGRL